MASSGPVSRIDIPSNGQPDIPAIKARRDKGGTRKEAPAPFDFALHGPTANDIYLLKITAFSFATAVTIVALSYGIAAGILKLF